MADPKIKYDIEAAVKGEADADKLAQALRGVGDALEGDLQQNALQAAQALEALGSKQRAVENFGALKRETETLSTSLTKATEQVDRLGNELPQATANTQAMAAAERAAAATLEQAQANLQSKRAALKAVREETQGAARRTDEYKTTVAGLQQGIKAATAEISASRDALRTSAQAANQAQNAEAALRKEYDLAIGSSARLSTELGNKRRALSESRELLQAVGISTNNLVQAENGLRTAVAQVRQEVASLAPAFQQAAAASSQSTQVQAQNQRTLREGMTSISTQLQRIQQIATVALGGSYVGGLAKTVAQTADEFKNLEARVKLATGEGPVFQASFEGVTRVALATNSALDETGTLFARISKAGQDAGLSAQQASERALGLTQTINQTIQLSGGSADAAKAAVTQLIQGLQSGVLRGEEFNSVMEQAPRLAQALADGLQVTTGELRNLAGQGALTADVVMKSLRGQADVVAGEFAKLPSTVGRALQNLSSQWTLYVGQADNGMVSSANAAKVINALAGNLDTLVTTLTSAGKLWAAMKIAGLAADFGAWALKTVTATTAVEANTLALAGNTTAQVANAAAQAQNTAAQTANIAATTAATAARTANASAWASIATFTGASTTATRAATAATAAGTVATTVQTAALGGLGLAMRGVTGLLGGPVGLIATAVLFSGEIKRGIVSVTEWAASFTEAGQAMKRYEAETKRAAETAAAAHEARKEQLALLQRQTELYERATGRAADLSKQAVGMVAEFGKLTQAGDSAADAIGKIGKDFDLSKSEGVRTASAVLDKLLADGKLTASEFRDAWAKALDGQDLAKFEVLARQAFAAAGDEAKKLEVQIQQAIASGASPKMVDALRDRLAGALAVSAREAERTAQVMDNVLRAAVQRTGLDFQQLQGGISKASASALNDLEVVIGGLDRLRAEGVDAGRVLEASFVKAIDTADSQKAIDAVRTRVEQMRSVLGNKVADGLLDQAREKADALAEAVDRAKPGVNSLAEAMKNLGVVSDKTLTETAAKSKASYDEMATSGKASLRELSDGFRRAAQEAIDANKGIAPSWVVAQAGVRGYKIETDAAGKSSLVATDKMAKGWNDVGRAAQGAGAAAAAAAEANQKALQAILDRNKVGDGSDLVGKSGDVREAAVMETDINQDIVKRYGADALDDPNTRKAWELRQQLQSYQRNYGNTRSKQSLDQQRNIAAELARVEGLIEANRIKAERERERASGLPTLGSTGGSSSGSSGGNSGGSSTSGTGSGGTRQPSQQSGITRVVNITIPVGDRMQSFPIPTTGIGEASAHDLAKAVVNVFAGEQRRLGR